MRIEPDLQFEVGLFLAFLFELVLDAGHLGRVFLYSINPHHKVFLSLFLKGIFMWLIRYRYIVGYQHLTILLDTFSPLSHTFYTSLLNKSLFLYRVILNNGGEKLLLVFAFLFYAFFFHPFNLLLYFIQLLLLDLYHLLNLRIL